MYYVCYFINLDNGKYCGHHFGFHLLIINVNFNCIQGLTGAYSGPILQNSSERSVEDFRSMQLPAERENHWRVTNVAAASTELLFQAISWSTEVSEKRWAARKRKQKVTAAVLKREKVTATRLIARLRFAFSWKTQLGQWVRSQDWRMWETDQSVNFFVC